MALDVDTQARRVKAARELAGLEQDELGKLMKADNLGVTDAGRLERPHSGKSVPKMTEDRANSLARHTGLPPGWFTEPDLGSLFAETADQPWLTARVEALEAGLAQLRSLALAGPDEEQDLREQLERGDAFAPPHAPRSGRPEDQTSGEANG